MPPDQSNTEDRFILVAASPLISAQAIDFFLSDLPDVMSEGVAVMQGNPYLHERVQAKWISAKSIKIKSRSEIRDALTKAVHLILLWDGEDLTNLLFEARLLAVPTKVIPIEVTRVVNKTTTNDYDIYIGRGSLWGNPFAIGHGEGPDREEVIKKYKEYFDQKLIDDSSFRRGILGLRGLRLACYCKPQACHGDVIAAYLDKLPKVESDSSKENLNN